MDHRTLADDVRPVQDWLHTHNTAGGGRPSRRSSHRFLGVFTVLLGVLGVAGSIAPSASAAAVTDPGYVLYTNTDGSIARWNSCHTIHYRVNDASGGPGALGDVFSAVTQLETASGLQLVYDGPSTDIPQSDYAAATNPDNPAPLLIAWAAPGQSNVLTGGSELGFSGTTVKTWTGPDGVAHPTQIVSGYTVFAATPALTAGFGPATYATRDRMLLHELGHIAGLIHTTDPNQVMYPIVDGRAGDTQSFVLGDAGHAVACRHGSVVEAVGAVVCCGARAVDQSWSPVAGGLGAGGRGEAQRDPGAERCGAAAALWPGRAADRGVVGRRLRPARPAAGRGVVAAAAGR